MASRLYRAFKSIDRLGEVKTCITDNPNWLQIVPAYLSLTKLSYPYQFRTRQGQSLELADWWDLTTAWVIFFGNEYLIKPTDKTIVDLGANIGAFVLYAAAIAPEAEIVAVEPFPSTYKILEKCIERNQLEHRVTCSPLAVTPHDGTAKMIADSTIPSPCRNLMDQDDSEHIEIESVSLKTLFERHNLDSIDFLKMDIEGTEYELVEQSDVDTLRRAKRIGLEYHVNGDRHALWSKLENAGFTCSRHPKQGMPGVAEFTRQPLMRVAV